MIQLINRSGKFKRQLKENELEALHAMGEALVKNMNQYVSVKTGYLKSRNSYKIANNELYAHNDCRYGIYQEFGTRFQKGTPFMRPAAFNHITEYKNIWATILRKGMD